jgi:hypothetical protein
MCILGEQVTDGNRQRDIRARQRVPQVDGRVRAG